MAHYTHELFCTHGEVDAKSGEARAGFKCPECHYWIYTEAEIALSEARDRACDFRLVEDEIKRSHYTRDTALDEVGLSEVLKRVYGPQYEFKKYRAKLEASEEESYQLHRYWVGRRSERPQWRKIAERHGGKVGPDPVHQLMYAKNPFCALLPKESRLSPRC